MRGGDRAGNPIRSLLRFRFFWNPAARAVSELLEVVPASTPSCGLSLRSIDLGTLQKFKSLAKRTRRLQTGTGRGTQVQKRIERRCFE